MSKDTEPDFKRPNHPDFMDSSELKKLQFSGVRANKLTQQMEIWLLGEVRASMAMKTVKLFPEKWERLYAEIFALEEVKVEGTEKPKSPIIFS